MNEKEQLDYLTRALRKSADPQRADRDKSKDELIAELQRLRKRLAEVEPVEVQIYEGRERADVERLQQMFQLIIDTIPVSIWWKDKESRFLGCNIKVAQAAGFNDPHELIGKTDYDCPWKKEESDWFVEWDRKVMETNRPHRHIIEPKLTAEGRQVWLDTTKVPLHDSDGNVVGTLGTYEDITERKEAEVALQEAHNELADTVEELRKAHFLLEERVKERTRELEERNLQLNDLSGELIQARDQAMEASQYKSMFLANMSHEIRTPLNSVVAVTELLLKTSLNGEQIEFANIIQNSSRALLDIVQDILDFSKIEAGKVELVPDLFDLRNLLKSVIDLSGAKAAEKDLVLTSRIVGDMPVPLLGDASRLKQVLLNLVSNAIKFTNEGKIDVVLSVDEITDKDCAIKFTVRDTGIGLSEDNAAKLFEPFTQADGSITRRFGGTGLGLSISKELVHLMNGEIGVSGKEGEGSTFWFKLRLDLAPETTLVSSSELVQSQTDDVENEGPIPSRLSSESKIQVLVADDSPLNRTVALLVLKHLGMEGHAVSNGEEAIQAIEDRRFDLVLMDCQMPLLDGFETARRIRKKAIPSKVRIPIIALTAQAVDGDREKCLEAGMDDYITKPITPTRLSVVLSRWVPLDVVTSD
ncbi:MAG: response regulator [Candidatus Obscuribacterales bacterium]|nr:response regulator [Candidatus Obscuribacterales bacterium]